ncbi:hypothetical protein M2321_001929 [Rhodoblastus acidophilus]|nr:hypothetical protein [Rhodoblastus acidophilus]MCW2274353.1 hypothetical protein [Rhodoblastus acidophilus]
MTAQSLAPNEIRIDGAFLYRVLVGAFGHWRRRRRQPNCVGGDGELYSRENVDKHDVVRMLGDNHKLLIQLLSSSSFLPPG